MSLEAIRVATKLQTYDVLSCLKQLFKDVIYVSLEYVEFARPGESPKLLNDRDSPLDIYHAVMRWINDRPHIGLGHIAGNMAFEEFVVNSTSFQTGK